MVSRSCLCLAAIADKIEDSEIVNLKSGQLQCAFSSIDDHQIRMSTSTAVPPVVQLQPVDDNDDMDAAGSMTRLRSAVDRLDDAYGRAFNNERPSNRSFYVRAPGRVNLIGEHIDYCGYAVLPMAIEQCILMAVDEDPCDVKSITLLSTHPKYESFSCQLDDIKVPDGKVPHWYNYVLAGFLGIRDHLKLSNPKGMRLIVDGSVPPSAGLSSSSALVCASALATAHINGHKIPKFELACICAKSERYVGMEGGGMDQAICFLGEPGTAKLIEFKPLRTLDVALPVGYVFVIANSLADANKAATSHYNTRVVECRLATKVLAKSLGLAFHDLKLLSELDNDDVGGSMADKVRQILHVEPYSRQEVCELLDMNDDELASSCLNQNTLHLQEFKLHQRALHVYTESQRVIDFKKVCDANEKDAAQRLGALMNESHASCKDMYECSHPDLDELVQLARRCGALGSRLTGAGWGGCTVSLVPEMDVDLFLAQVRLLYYAANEERKQRLATSIFPTAPASGAAIYVKSQ